MTSRDVGTKLQLRPKNGPSRMQRPRLPDFAYKGTYAYHVILRTQDGKPAPSERSAAAYCAEKLLQVASQLEFRILAYCVMSTHLHVLIQGVEPSSDLMRFVQRFKHKTSFHNKRQSMGSRLWQQSFYDRVLRDDEDLEVVARYVLANPIKAGLVENVWEYEGSGGEYFAAFKDGAKASSLRPDSEEPL